MLRVNDMHYFWTEISEGNSRFLDHTNLMSIYSSFLSCESLQNVSPVHSLLGHKCCFIRNKDKLFGKKYNQHILYSQRGDKECWTYNFSKTQK